MRLIIAVTLICALAVPCCGFESEKHGPISLRAITVYQVCTGRTLPDEFSAAFVRGSIDEDGIDWRLERLRNWHFYNERKNLKYYWEGFCYGGNEIIFEKRTASMNSLRGAGKSAGLYYAAGRVAHHIQDMASPPHVMPVYHTSGDAFDSYTPAPQLQAVLPGLCQGINEGCLNEPIDILNRTARDTLDAINKKVEFQTTAAIEGETWKNFWDGPPHPCYEGFKDYGSYGNSFGAARPCGKGPCPPYDAATYDKFYNDCYMRAVKSTVLLLRYLDR